MMISPAWLLEFKKNVYSEDGIDGVIEKIFGLLPEHDKWCVEFGTWDGIRSSNICYLIRERNYSGVLIESDKKRFEELRRNYIDNKKVLTLNRFVGFEENDNLDQVLAQTSVPYDFDFLSIDIDGNDYHVWKAVNKYKPKVVCIEFNSTIPNEIQFIQPADKSVSQGNSLRSMVELGQKKKYELVSVLSYNAIFVKQEYFRYFDISDNRIEILRKDLKGITYIFSGYDGSIFLRGNRTLPWHNLVLQESRMQQLPKFVRKFPEQYTLFQKALFMLLKKPLNIPQQVLRKVSRNIFAACSKK